MHKHFFALGVLVLLLVLISVFLAPWSPRPVTGAGNAGELTGWAWSSNIGWISFNCSEESPACPNGQAFGGGGYAVKVDPVTGELDGWAWTSNVGWITFKKAGTSAGNDLTGCPQGTCSAVLVVAPSSNGRRQLTGWARAVAPNASGVSGWDGWISLSPKTGAPLNEANSYDPTAVCTSVAGTAGCYGPRMDTNNQFSGFAWGGDVVGWIDFGAIGTSPAKPVTLNPSGLAPSVTITPSQTSVEAGEAVNVAWTADNALACTPSSSPTQNAWNSAAGAGSPPTGGTVSGITLSTLGTQDFTLSCSGPGGIRVTTGSVTVGTPDPSGFSLTAQPTSVAVSFVSNKKETSTKTNIKVVKDGTFSKVVTLSLIGPTNQAEITGLKGVVPVARFRDRETGSATDTLGPADYTAGRDLFIHFPCTGSQCAVAAGTYHFTVRGTPTGALAPVDLPLTVTVQSFIPTFKEQ